MEHGDVARDHGRARGRGLQDRETEALGDARHAHRGARGVERGEPLVADAAEDVDAGAETVPGDRVGDGVGAEAGRPREHEAEIRRNGRAREGGEQRVETLAGRERADREQERTRRRELRTRTRERGHAVRSDDDALAIDATRAQRIGGRLRDRDHDRRPFGRGRELVTLHDARPRRVQLGVLERDEVVHREHERLARRRRDEVGGVHDVAARREPFRGRSPRERPAPLHEPQRHRQVPGRPRQRVAMRASADREPHEVDVAPVDRGAELAHVAGDAGVAREQRAHVHADPHTGLAIHARPSVRERDRSAMPIAAPARAQKVHATEKSVHAWRKNAPSARPTPALNAADVARCDACRDSRRSRPIAVIVSPMNTAMATTPVSMPTWRYEFSPIVAWPSSKRCPTPADVASPWPRGCALIASTPVQNERMWSTDEGSREVDVAATR